MDTKILSQDEIYQILITALIQKTPPPPEGWCASQLDEELFRATREYEPDSLIRQKDALETSLFYLVDYAQRMPERVNLTESNNRVKEMCQDLASEIEKITLEPESVINKHGKLKVLLIAILSVRTCLIYCQETDRHIAEQEKAKRLQQIARQKKKSPPKRQKSKDKWQSDLAKIIFQKTVSQANDDSSGQPSLF